MIPSPLRALIAALALAPALQAQRGTVVVSNMNDATATVIDAATGRVVATLATGEGPHEVTVSRDGRTAAVSNYGLRGKPGNTISIIDVARAEVVRTLTITGHQRPHGMAFLPGDTLLAVTAEASKALLLVDVRDGRVVTTRPTSGRVSHMVSLTADGERAFTGNIADGTLSMLTIRGTDSARVVKVARQPEGLAATPDGRLVFVGSNADSVVLVVDAASGAVVDTLRGFGLPYRMQVTPDGRTVVVTDPMKAQVRAFDVNTRRARWTLDVPADSLVSTAEVPRSPSPEGITTSRDGRHVFVTLQGRNRMIVIDTDNGSIVRWAPTGTWSDGIGFSPIVSKR